MATTSMRGDDVDEDKEGSDSIYFLMQDCFFSDERSLFVSFLCVRSSFVS